MAANRGIQGLNALGQSVWFDDLSKALLKTGELKALIDAGVSGLTSNPTIFMKAITESSDYDNDIARLASQGLSDAELCEALMVEDVGRAADYLRDTWERTNGADGYASIEVSPHLARDPEETLQAAQRIWNALARPNVMIKIPGTPECVSAVERALSQGININITLLFSVRQYEKVAMAYLTACETRLSLRLPVSSLASVASFFVSRVDAICEKSFDALVQKGAVPGKERAGFFGKAGIANAVLAYARFMEIFESPRFTRLAASGARRQRPLWASTGTKNPAFNPLMYVHGLAGSNTVNTMPPATLKALMATQETERGIPGDVELALKVLHHLSAHTIDFEGLMEVLQNEGVRLFAKSYDDLIEAIRERRRKA